MATGNHRSGKVSKETLEAFDILRTRFDPSHLYYGHGFPEISRFKMCPPPKEVIEKYNNHLSINEAIGFAKKMHGDQKDDGGLNYFEAHVCKVADIISLVSPNDPNLIKAAYLHDTLEDTKTTYEELKQNFGHDVADLVLEVTHEGDREHGYYFPRLKTQRGIVLKFADRLHNLSRMEPWGRERKEHYLKKSKFWKSE